MSDSIMMLAAALLLGATGAGLVVPNVDFNNFTYAKHPCGPKPIALHNGHGDYDLPDQRVTLSLDMGSVYRGRLGQRDAAVVVLSCGAPVGSESGAYAFAIDGSRATYLETVGDLMSGEGGY